MLLAVFNDRLAQHEGDAAALPSAWYRAHSPILPRGGEGPHPPCFGEQNPNFIFPDEKENKV